MNQGPRKLACIADLHLRPLPEAEHFVDLRLHDIGGGRMTNSMLDTIAERPSARLLHVSGLDQRTFEYLVEVYGEQFEGISFWKCPKIADLSPLEGLSRLSFVFFYWNQRATRLWDLRRTPGLTGLSINQFQKLNNLDDLAVGAGLTELSFGDVTENKMVVASLHPLAANPQLTSLKFFVRGILDRRIEPLSALRSLTTLHFPSSIFAARQIAWLRAHLPASVVSESLDPVVSLGPVLTALWNGKDVQLAGRRGRVMSSTLDAARVERRRFEFARAVREYEADPALLPDESPL